MARIRTNVYDSITGKYLLLPKGTKLLGQYNSKVAPGQSRLQIKFLRLIRPDGSSISLPGQKKDYIKPLSKRITVKSLECSVCIM